MSPSSSRGSQEDSGPSGSLEDPCFPRWGLPGLRQERPAALALAGTWGAPGRGAHLEELDPDAGKDELQEGGDQHDVADGADGHEHALHHVLRREGGGPRGSSPPPRVRRRGPRTGSLQDPRWLQAENGRWGGKGGAWLPSLILSPHDGQRPREVPRRWAEDPGGAPTPTGCWRVCSPSALWLG